MATLSNEVAFAEVYGRLFAEFAEFDAAGCYDYYLGTLERIGRTEEAKTSCRGCGGPRTASSCSWCGAGRMPAP